MRQLMFTSVWLAVASLAGAAEPATYTITVSAGDADSTNVPVRATLPGDAAESLERVSLQTADGKPVAVQGVSGSDREGAWLEFVIPELKAGQTQEYLLRVGTDEAKPTDAAPSPVFRATLRDNGQRETYFGDRLVARYMFTPMDDSSPERRYLTYKPFHHLYDPADGETVLTGGPDAGAEKELQFPHHRGLFFGFNRITYGNTKADVWHCRGDDHQLHEKFVSSSTGPVMDRSTSLISWRGTGKNAFANEYRTVTFYNLPGGTLVEFEATVVPQVDVPVKLDGDPQHAGVQFRATHVVSKETPTRTYYLRPDGKGKENETRNWEPKSGDGPENLPWNALCFLVGDQRYTVVYLDHPDNPKPARYSERNYGRFGSYFEYTMTEDQPLQVRYRLWLQPGEMTVDECEELNREFVSPPTVKVTKG